MAIRRLYVITRISVNSNPIFHSFVFVQQKIRRCFCRAKFWQIKQNLQPQQLKDNMKFLLKNLIIYTILSFLSTLIFILYLCLTGYPPNIGGLIPLIVMANCLTSFAIAIVLIMVLKYKIEISPLKSALIFTIVYLLTVFYNSNPFKSDIDGTDIMIYLCEIIPFGLFLYHNKYHNKGWKNLVIVATIHHH